LGGHGVAVAGGGIQLLLQVAGIGLGRDQVDLELGQLCLVVLRVQLIGRGVQLEQHFALLDRAVGGDGHFRDDAFHLRIDRHDVVDDAHVGRRRRHDVEEQDQGRQSDDGKGDGDDLADDVPGQPLELEEDEPGEKRVDAE
jgi:hypothetical protein